MTLRTPRSAARLPGQALRCLARQNVPSVTRPLASTCSRTLTTSTWPSASESTEYPHAAQSARSADTAAAELPRWAETPIRMKAPFSPHIRKNPSRAVWHVNSDPQKLDEALNSFLGRDGQKMLTEELKWLAVTHKSFDQGRRGFNDRLAFLGRQICIFEATESIITDPPAYDGLVPDPFAQERQPFEDAALRSVDNLSKNQPMDLFTLDKLLQLAIDTGLSKVVRWKPRMPEKEVASGSATVMAGAVYALVGAIALQNGGKVASKIVRERIIKRITAVKQP
ncbi:RNase III domain-containing protein [Nemania sp. NC0429]|nr:RNase III domain-containing protein [Nemania sp. NC0429]